MGIKYKSYNLWNSVVFEHNGEGTCQNTSNYFNAGS
jgi:hypothetical protein